MLLGALALLLTAADWRHVPARSVALAEWKPVSWCHHLRAACADCSLSFFGLLNRVATAQVPRQVGMHRLAATCLVAGVQSDAPCPQDTPAPAIALALNGGLPAASPCASQAE